MAKAKKSEATLTLEEKLEQALVAADEQPYKVPDNWCWVYLNKGFAYCLDNFRKPVNAAERSTMQGDIPYYGATGQVGWINDFLTDEHLVLVGEDGAPFLDYAKDKAYIIDGKAWVNNHAHILRSFYGKESNVYLMHYLNIFDYHGYVNGSTRLKLTQSSMNSIPVPLPPVKEQKRIVDHIETFFSKLDEVKENVQNVIDGFENRKSAILHKAFNGELTAKWRKENHIDRELWESKSIADLFTHTTGKALKKDNKEGILHKYITTSNLYWGMFDFTEVRKMYFTDREIDKCTAKKGDLLICNGGDVGRAAIWDYDYDICLQNHISKLRKKQDNLEVRFFFYYFMLSKLKGNINSKGIGISSLSAKDLLAMSVKLPTLQEQIEIVRILDNILLKQQQAKEKAEDVLERIELIKKSILARAFRGELGTNNPDEESSLELLKMVLSEDKDEKTISKPESK